MSTLVLTYRAIHNKITYLSLPRINWKIFYSLVVVLLFSLLIFYVFLVNELTRGAYLVKNYNKEIRVLLQENKVLEANFAQPGLLGQVTQKASELNFEKTANIKYMQILENSLAKAQ